MELTGGAAATDTGGLVAGVISNERDDGSVWLGVGLRRDDDPMLGHILDGVAHSARSGRSSIDYFDTTLWFAPDFNPAEAAAIVRDVAASYQQEAAKRRQGLEDVEARRYALEAELEAR